MSLPPSAAKKRSVACSVALYRALMSAYPAPFRRLYGGPMVQAFRDTCRQAEESHGLAGVLVLWLPTLADLLKTASAERFASIWPVSRSLIICCCGLLTMLGAAFGLLFIALSLLIHFKVVSGNCCWEYLHPSVPVRVFFYTQLLSIPVALLCLTFGLIGVLLMQQGRMGRLSGALAVLGHLIPLLQELGAVLETLWAPSWMFSPSENSLPNEVGFVVFFYGSVVLWPAVLVLFGLVSFRAAQTRSIGLLLLLLGLNNALISFVFFTLDSGAFWLVLTVTLYLLWGALGYALWRSKAQPQRLGAAPGQPVL